MGSCGVFALQTGGRTFSLVRIVLKRIAHGDRCPRWHITSIRGEEYSISIQTVGAVGPGTMCNGIAQVAAVAGLKVIVIDVADAALAKGIAALTGSLERLVSKDKL